MTGIAHPLDATLEVLKFLGSFTFGTKQVSDAQDEQYEADGEDKLDTYRKIANGIVHI